MTALHSFAVLAHKVSPYLEECLASLTQQTLPSEIYLSTSTPSSFLSEVAQRHDIPLFVNAHSHGIASDWSFAYSLARTRYVTLAHQDDIYLPEYSQRCVSEAERHPNSLITFTDYAQIVRDKPQRPSPLLLIKNIMLLPFFVGHNTLSTPLLKRALLSMGSPISCPSVMFHTANIGNFSFNDQLSVTLDWEAWLRLANRRGDFVYVKKRLMLHRIHPESETSKGISDSRRLQEDRLMFELLWWKPLARALSRLYALSYHSNHCQ